MTDLNLPHTFDKGNSLPQSGAVDLSWLRNEAGIGNELKSNINRNDRVFYGI